MNKRVIGLLPLIAFSLIGCDQNSRPTRSKYSLNGKREAPVQVQPQVVTDQVQSCTLKNDEKIGVVATHVDNLNCKMNSLHQENVRGDSTARTVPYSEGSGIVLEGDFLYWEARQDGLEFAIDHDFSVVENQKAKQLDLRKKWEPGFRIGLNALFGGKDEWELKAAWSYLKSRQTTRADVTETERVLLPTWGMGTLGYEANRAYARHKIHYNVIDVELARHYFMSHSISARPYVGVRGAIIEQHYRVRYDDIFVNASPVPADEYSLFRARNDFWGVGLKAGTEMTYHLTKNFGIFGKVSGSLLTGEFYVREKYSGFEENSNPPPALVNANLKLKEHMDRIRFNVEMQLGLNMNYCFNNGNGVEIFAGYDLVNWFDQNMLWNTNLNFRAQQDVLNLDETHGNLSFHGLTARARLRF